MTNFGWEYVWHCHLLGHEENDMMRPLVFQVSPPAAPTGLAATVPSPTSAVLTWSSTDPDATGFTLQRATNATFTAGLTTFTIDGNATKTYTDNSVTANARYFYRVLASNPAGNSAFSNVVTVITAVPPANFAATFTRTGTTDRAALSWTAAPGTFTNYTIQRARNTAFTTGLVTATAARTATTATQTGLARNRQFWFRIRTNITGGSSAWSTIGPILSP